MDGMQIEDIGKLSQTKAKGHSLKSETSMQCFEAIEKIS